MNNIVNSATCGYCYKYFLKNTKIYSLEENSVPGLRGLGAEECIVAKCGHCFHMICLRLIVINSIHSRQNLSCCECQASGASFTLSGSEFDNAAPVEMKVSVATPQVALVERKSDAVEEDKEKQVFEEDQQSALKDSTRALFNEMLALLLQK